MERSRKAEVIRVYQFKLWDQQRQEYFVAPYKSPADLISQIGGVILTNTGESVEPSKLDNEQRYDPGRDASQLVVDAAIAASALRALNLGVCDGP